MAEITDTYNIDKYEVWTDTGWENISAVHKTIPYEVWTLKTENFKLKCADKHIVFDDKFNEVFVEDLATGDFIQTENGVERVISVARIGKAEQMYDITVDSDNHRLFTGGILSHNTTLMTIFALWYACFKEDQHVLIVANKEATAIEIFRRIRLAYKELPNWLKPGVTEWAKTSMELANGSRIGITTTSSTAGRGSSCDILILDELAHIEPNLMKQFWSAVFPIISASKKSKILIASTPNGTDNLFYQLWDGAEKGENGWSPLKIHWSEIPGRDEKWAKETKQTLESEELWQQEFELQFLASGQSAIDFELFAKMEIRCREPELSLDDGEYKLYGTPNDDRVYVAGIDTSEGIGQDASVIEIFDITDLSCIEQMAEYKCKTISPYEFATKAKEILAHWGNPLACIERNNQGAQVIDKLVNEIHYPNIVNYGQSAAGRKNGQMGMISHTNTKRRAIMNARYWINELDAVHIYSKDVLLELKHFLRKPNQTWGAATGWNDDLVMSLYWALMILDTDIVEQYFEVIEVDQNRKPRILKQIDYGTRYFSNPESIYSMAAANNEAIGMPTIIGHGSQQSSDIDELYAAGWRIPGQQY